MNVLITGASSGIGKDMARYLASLGHDLILVARREERLKELQEEFDVNVMIIEMDLSKEGNVYQLYEILKESSVDVLINNAGFGLFGCFEHADLKRELEMIDVNIKACHILTKLFLKDFMKRNHGYILNVASSAGFMAGPSLSTYYATKNYVLKLTLAIYEEIRRSKKHVHISALCPGPVHTEFNQVAKGRFAIHAISSEYCARYAIDKLFKHKLIIIPGFTMKAGIFFNRFLPYKTQLRIVHQIQQRKQG